MKIIASRTVASIIVLIRIEKLQIGVKIGVLVGVVGELPLATYRLRELNQIGRTIPENVIAL